MRGVYFIQRGFNYDIREGSTAMKTFTATHFNKHPQDVYTAAKEDGTVLIEHDRYEGRFAIVWNRDYSEDEALEKINSDPVPDQ